MPYGNFYVGKSGFLYKKMGGGGNHRIFSLSAICNQPQDLNNRYISGSGVGAVTTPNRRLLQKRAAFCSIYCPATPTPTPTPIPPNPPINPCLLLPTITPYQICSPWPQVGGLYNSNSGYSPFIAKYKNPPVSVNLNIFQINTSMTIAKDGTIYVIGYYMPSSDAPYTGLFAFNSDGSTKWTSPYQLQGASEGSAPSIGPDGTIYFGDTNAYFYAIKDYGSYGAINPIFNSGAPYHLSNSISGSPLINQAGTIIFCDVGGQLHFFSPDSSNTVYYLSTSLPSIGVGTLASVAISSDGQNIYIGVNDDITNIGSLFNISPNGISNWGGNYYKNTFETIILSPSISKDGSTVYIGTNNLSTQQGTIWGIQSTTYPGANWSYDLPNDTLGNPYSITNYNNSANFGIGFDGTIYVSCTSISSCALIALQPSLVPTIVPTLKWIYSFNNTINISYQNISSPTVDSTSTIFCNIEAYNSSTSIYSCSVYAIKDLGTSAVLTMSYYMGNNTNLVNSPVIGANGILYSSSSNETAPFNISNLIIFT
jgi:hypothetical protein